MSTPCSPHITLRPASPADAPFIAQCVFAALGEDFSTCTTEEKQTKLTRMTTICEQTDTLYSWRNTLLAEADRQQAGVLVSYDGARYATLRQTTFSRLGDLVSEAVLTMQDETQAGEYYLDSLAVSTAFRRQGIARRLLLQGIDHARQNGFSQASLVVIPDSMAMHFYQSLGFVPAGIMYLFGEDYLRMTYAL